MITTNEEVTGKKAALESLPEQAGDVPHKRDGQRLSAKYVSGGGCCALRRRRGARCFSGF